MTDELPLFEKKADGTYLLTANGREKATKALEKACKARRLTGQDQVLLTYILNFWKMYTNQALEEGYL